MSMFSRISMLPGGGGGGGGSFGRRSSPPRLTSSGDDEDDDSPRSRTSSGDGGGAGDAVGRKLSWDMMQDYLKVVSSYVQQHVAQNMGRGGGVGDTADTKCASMVILPSRCVELLSW